MKQGKQFMKVIMLVLAFMVASYILYHVVQSASSGVPTAQAVLYEASDGVSVEGFLVRQETVIPAAYDLVLPSKDEGEKVAAGEEVAVSLRSAGAQERQEEIAQLEQELEQLQLALTYQTQLTDSEAVAERVGSAASSFAAQVVQGRLETSDTAAMAKQVSEMQGQLAAMEASATADTKSIVAQSAGYYSAVTDGYEEQLTPQVLEDITVSEFQDLWKQTPTAPGQTAGRLITSGEWYYACTVESRYLEGLETGDSLTVTLGGEVSLELEMTVTRVNREQELGLLVLASQDKLSSISALRRLNADLIFHTYSGLRVPREAVCYSEESGSAGVYVLVGTKAVWKDIELLYDNGDTYIAALNQSSTDYLWPEDLILLDTEGLFDGKLVD